MGAVGCGKSTILAGVLGEVSVRPSGSVGIRGHVVYCPQQAWVRSATVRDNILMGLPMHSKRYATAIQCCALQPDLDILPSGDMTEIGERGVTLSGGQKQRIRCVVADERMKLAVVNIERRVLSSQCVVGGSLLFCLFGMVVGTCIGSLARAVYSIECSEKPGLCLLDDPLSAVGTSVLL